MEEQPVALADDHAVAEQLRQQLDVGRFAAAGAGAGELEQRLHAVAAGASCVTLSLRRSNSGRSRKKSQFSRSVRAGAAAGAC